MDQNNQEKNNQLPQQTSNYSFCDGEKFYLLPASIILGALIIAGAILYSNGALSSQKSPSVAKGDIAQPTNNSRPSGSSVDVENVDTQNEPFIGQNDAPLTMAYWLDFQCPFCKRFDLQTLPQLIEKYVKTGKLKIVFKDFQFLGSDSQDAGLVANAVWELYPESYFKWHQTMFEAQDEENGGFGDLASILELIRKEIPEIDADEIAKQVEKKRADYQKEIDADKNEGVSFGISGTPSFIIGNQRISGAQPTAVFEQIIESELKK